MVARLLILILIAPAWARAQQIDTLALRAHTRFLADDQLEGRGTGTRGEARAAAYIESQLRTIGVQPAKEGSYRQTVPLRRARLDSARLILRSGADSLVFSSEDFVINAGGRRSLQSFDGDAVFLGTAEQARAVSDTMVAGRVLVLAGTLGADAQTLVPRWLRAGVRGVIILTADSTQFELLARSRGDAHYFIDADVDDPVWQAALPMLIGGPALSRALIASIRPRLARPAQRDSFPPIPLGRHVRVVIHVSTSDVRSANIMAVIPGTDARLRNEYVVYTAHYDHLGITAPDARGDSIYNGFSDNAAGVAMLLAIAHELASHPLRRSVAFLFLTGEERGLLGSTYYVSAPLLPLDRTVAVINLDGGAPPAPPIQWRIAGGSGNRLGELAQQVALQHGWRAETSPASPNSDYWPFHARGVPAVFIIPGSRWEGLTDAQRDALRARWDRYHRADDEFAEQFPFAGLQRYAVYALLIGRAAAE